MRVSITKSKNSESFYITKSYINDKGKSTSKIIRRLGTLRELSEMLQTDRDGVLAWAREQAAIETEKYKKRNRKRPYSSLSMPTGCWITTSRGSLKADTCSSSLSIMNSG